MTNNLVTAIVLGSGVRGRALRLLRDSARQLCGFVYVDLNNNGLKEAGEQGIAGVTLELLDANGQPTGVTIVTDATGDYCFVGLRPGTYGVREFQPVGYYDGLDTPGDAGGAAHNPGDSITGAVLKGGQHGENYNFGELLPVSISGKVHVNTTGDCDDPANPPLAGVTIHLLDSQGNVIGTATTDADGTLPVRQPGARHLRRARSAARRLLRRRDRRGLGGRIGRGESDHRHRARRGHARRALRLLRNSAGHALGLRVPGRSADRGRERRATCPTCWPCATAS